MTEPITTPYPPGEPAYCAGTSRSGLHAVRLTCATGAAGRNRIAEALCGELVSVTTITLPARTGEGFSARSNVSYLPALTAAAAKGEPACELCAWARAARDGSVALSAELERIRPTDEVVRVLSGSRGDPLLAYRTAARIIAWYDDDILNSDLIGRLLAHVARHRAVPYIYEDCTTGECGHPKQGTLDGSVPVCLTPAGWATCPACSVYDCPETITAAPCTALLTVARSHLILTEGTPA